MTQADLQFVAEHVVTPDGVLDDAVVEIHGDRVVAVRPAADLPVDTARVEGWVVPGFVDTHVHGGGGYDFATLDPAEAASAREFHARHGTTTSFASLVTAPIDVLCAQLATLSELVADGQLAGVHLEGPFLSPNRRGAHDPTHLIAPDRNAVERLIAAGGDALAMVTMAPELPGALRATERYVDAGVRVAVGHTEATDEQVDRALGAGASVGTHVFNAMDPIHHRVPGPVPRLLMDDRAAAELIADGFHVHPEILRLALAVTGPDRFVLVTDAMAATGMPDGAYRLGGLDVEVVAGEARLVGDEEGPGSIAGSTLTMAGAFAFMVRLGVDLPTVARLASSNAARGFGLDAGYVGPGGPADLCVVGDTGTLRGVMQRGRWLDLP